MAGESETGVRTEVQLETEGWHGQPGPRAEQMSATTLFLTPVPVLVALRKHLAEKFMTLGGSCPPSKAACTPPAVTACSGPPTGPS